MGKPESVIDGLTRAESAIHHVFREHGRDYEPEYITCELLTGASCEWNENHATECHLYCVAIDDHEFTIPIIIT